MLMELIAHRHIEKDLDWEASLINDIMYVPLAGASENFNFRSPDSYVFIFFEKCKGWHSIDFVEYEEKDNQVHISFPGQIHSWKTEENAKGHKLILSKKFVETKLSDMSFSALYLNSSPVIDLPKDFAERIFAELKWIEKDFADEYVPPKILSFRIQLVLSLVNAHIEALEETSLINEKKHPIISKFLELIETDFTGSKSVSFYANKIAVTSNYLNILSKKELGVTAKVIINRKVILEAKRLLLGSDLTIKEIAFNLGFRSIAAFSSFMYNRTGMYPKGLRKEDVYH